MPERVHGGVFTDTLLTGSLQHYLLSGADFSGAVDPAGRPIAGSAAEVVFNEVSLKATIVIMRPEATGASFALETNRANWSAGELQGTIRSLGTIGVDVVDVSTVTVTLVPYSFREENIVSFLDLTDTPGTYAGHGDKQLAVVAGENGIEFRPVDVDEAPVDGNTYARRNSTWILVSPSLVDSVFGRTGAVTAQAGDYSASHVTNNSTVTGVYVNDALDDLQGSVDTINVALGGVVTDINDLGDVNTAGISIGDILKWDGANFVPITDTSVGSIGELSDVNLGGVSAGHILVWNGITFVPTPQAGGGAGAVDSVYGRVGAVTAAVSDYDASQVDNDSTVAGAFVRDALDTLETTKASVDGDDLLAPSLPGSTYGDAKDLTNLLHSSGVITGGDITNNGNGTVAVEAGIGMIRSANSPLGELFFMDFPADASVVLVDNAVNHLYVDYNAGTPIVLVDTLHQMDKDSKFTLGKVFRSGNELHINPVERITINDAIGSIGRRLIETDAYARVSGGLIAASGVRNISITAGVWYHAMEKYETASFNSAGVDTFSYLYRNGVGGWTEVPGQSQIDNTQYDDGFGTLTTLTDGRYGVHWIFLGVDGDVHIVYGQGDYFYPDAGNAVKLLDLPDVITGDARIIGKILIQKDDIVFTEVFSEFHTFLDRAVDKLRSIVDDLSPQLGGDLDTNGNIIDISVVADPAYQEGRLFYDTVHHGLAFFSDIANVKIQMGQETVIHAVNNTGDTIFKGTAVTISGTTGVEPTIAPIIATASTAHVTGMVGADILDGNAGIVMVYGTLEGVDTNGFTPGNAVYLSDAVAGNFVETPPTAPIDVIQLGTVIDAAVNGRILVDARTPSSIKAIADASDVDLTGVAADDFLKWNGTQFLPTSDVATSAQGILADSATQPGDNVSSLANDVGYLTAGTEGVYGSGFHHGSSEAVSNVVGSTYQNKLTVVTGVLAVGNYRVSWYGQQTTSSTSIASGFRVQIDAGTFICTETLNNKTKNDIFYPFSGFCIVQLAAAARTLTLDWKSDAPGGASDIKEVRLEIIRVE